MKISTLALFLGSALVVGGAGVGLVACSSDSSTGTPTPGDSGTGTDGSTHNDGSTPADSGMTPDTGTMDDGGDAGACTHGNPPKLHASDGGTLFCGFKPNDAGTLYCDPHTQECCVGGTQGTGHADAVCQQQGTTCTNGMGPKVINCEAPADCTTAGSVCCMTGTTPTLDTTCNYYRTGANITTSCVAPSDGGAPTCAAGQSQICTNDMECPTGKTCVPFKTIYFGLGFCQ
jgi:hypothetical protein